MPRITDYGLRATEYKVGDLVRVKRHSEWARLTDSHRLGKVEKVERNRLMVRLKHASFWVPMEDISQ